MTEINSVTTLTRDGEIAIVTLNSPPVNALSANVRDGLYEGFKAAIADYLREAYARGEGQLFGEMAYLLNETRTASVVAETDVTVLALPPHILEELMRHSAPLSRRIIDTLCQRHLLDGEPRPALPQRALHGAQFVAFESLFDAAAGLGELVVTLLAILGLHHIVSALP